MFVVDPMQNHRSFPSYNNVNKVLFLSDEKYVFLMYFFTIYLGLDKTNDWFLAVLKTEEIQTMRWLKGGNNQQINSY